MKRDRNRRSIRSRVEALEGRSLLTTLIALVDSGVDLSSAIDRPYYDLSAAYNAYTQVSAAQGGTGIAQDTSGQHGHGSTVADLIVQGIQATESQPGASGASVEIMPIIDTSSNLNIDSNALIRGVRYAAAHGAAVINLSVNYVGGDAEYENTANPNDPLNGTTLTQAIQYAGSLGSVVVTAAGNSGINIDDPTNPDSLYPADTHAANEIVATTVDASGNLIPSVSNWGPVHVDLGALSNSSGATSYSSGDTAGVVGVIAALRPDLSPVQIVSGIKASVQADPELAGKVTTGGVISPSNAVPYFTESLAIDAGTGGATGQFVADTDVVGGGTYSVSHAIDTSGLTSSVPPSVFQSEHNSGAGLGAGASFTYTIPNLTPGSGFQVRLYFAELFFNNDYRQFNVAINGKSVLTNFDPYDAAGGQYKAVAEEFTAVAAADGTITIQFTNVIGGAQCCGVAIVPTAADQVAIAAGGVATGQFAADTDVVGGGTYSVSNAINPSNLTTTIPQSVFQSEHNSGAGLGAGASFTYTIPGLEAGAAYTVQLDFAELFFNSDYRQFNVAINGKSVLTNFDPDAAAGGQYKAVAEDFTALAATDGTITIQFTNVNGGAQVSGIEIKPTI